MKVTTILFASLASMSLASPAATKRQTVTDCGSDADCPSGTTCVINFSGKSAPL